MRCPHPQCTGVHDNNRFSELCPRSRAAKRIKDSRYQSQVLVYVRRTLAQSVRRHGAQAERLGMEEWYEQVRAESAPSRQRTDELFLNRPKRQRPKVPTICTRLISVAQVLNYTRRPELRTWYH